MPMTEKEYNGNLLGILDLLERLEIANKDGGHERLMAQIEFEKKCVNRKLYQRPPLADDNG